MGLNTIIMLGILSPLAIFALVGLTIGKSVFDFESRESRLQHFLLAQGKATESEFVQSSVAYSLQIYITFFFIFWGFRYGYANVFYILSWFVGIVLFTYFAPKLLVVRTRWITVFALISQHQLQIRNTCSLIAMVALVSIVYMESFYTAHFLSALSGEEFGVATNTWWTYFSLIILVCLSYSLYGGLPKTYLTDKMQLSVAYLGMGLLIGYFCYIAQSQSYPHTYQILWIAIATYGVLLVNAVVNRAPTYLILSLGVPILIFTYSLSVDSIDQSLVAAPKIPSIMTQLNEEKGWFTLLGFSLANLLWQFGDPSNYQRIASLNLESNDQASSEKEIRRVLWGMSIASPLTWSFGILLGMAAAAAGIQAEFFSETSAIITFLRDMATANWVGIAVIAVFGAAVVSIMLSTVDSCVVAFSEVYLLDYRGKTGLSYRDLLAISLLVLLSVLLIAFLHVGLNTTTIERLVGWSASIIPIFAPIVICRLISKNLSDFVIMTTLVLGFSASALAAFYPFNLHENILLGLPMVSGIGVASTTVIIGTLMTRKAKEN